MSGHSHTYAQVVMPSGIAESERENLVLRWVDIPHRDQDTQARWMLHQGNLSRGSKNPATDSTMISSLKCVYLLSMYSPSRDDV